MSYTFDLSSMRHRNGGKSLTLANRQGHTWQTYDRRNSSRPPNNVSFTGIITEDYTKDMWDVVIKDFHRRSKAGEIFNNPKFQSESLFQTSVAMDDIDFVYTSVSDGLYQFNSSNNSPLYDTEAQAASRRTLSAPIDRLQNLALTSAYAGISANTQNAVLWLGEFRETVKMIGDIGKGLKALYDKTKKQRAEWAKGKLSVPEAQNLTLALLYGILPLEQSITQVMDGLFKLKPNGRETSRGFEVYTDTDVNTSSVDALGFTSYSSTSETLEVTIRAGVLYDIDVSSFPTIAIIADPKQVTEMVYAIARLSFVIDWFINVGNTIKAWSPSVGTKELSAWVTIKETYTQKYHYDHQRFGSKPNDSITSGSSAAEIDSVYETTVERRFPVSRSDLAILPRIDIDLNLSKINSLVLLFADAKSKR